MPGPMSSPSGDRSVLDARTREQGRQKGALHTGKTAWRRQREQRKDK